jgi:hypothetical protein
VVSDKKGNKVLDIKFLNPTTISILGNLYGPRGQIISIGEDAQQIGGNSLSHFCFGNSAVAIRVD